MNIPHTYLELLEKKGIPAKRRDIEITFKRNNNENVLEPQEIKPVQENEKDEMTEETFAEEQSVQMKPPREPKQI